MTPTEIRTAAYMTLAASEVVTKYSNRDVYINKVEFYSKDDDWYVIIYYNDDDECANKLDGVFVPGGWMQNKQLRLTSMQK